MGLAGAALQLTSGPYLQEISTNIIILNLVCLIQRQILNPTFSALSSKLDPARSLDGSAELYSRVEVKTGELVKCDGIVEEGVATVSERGLGPQAVERFKLKGDKLFAGTRVSQGTLRYRVEVPTAESTIAYFLAHFRGILKEITENSKSLGSKASNFLTVILFLSLFGSISSIISTGEILRGVLVGASLLAISGMVYLVPMTILLRQVTVLKLFFEGAMIRSATVLSAVRRVKLMVLDTIWRFGKAKLIKFQLLDSRLDESGLKLALINIFARIDEEPFVSLCEDLAKGLSRIDPLNLGNFQTYKSGGISANISGAEFSIGNEDFLIERGVYLQASELNTKSSKFVWYVALNEELVGYLQFEMNAMGYAKGLARRFGIKAKLFSVETPEQVDVLAEQVGFKYDDLVLGLTPQLYREKLMSLKPLALLATDKLPERAQEFADFTVGPFNRLTFQLNDWDLTFFDQTLLGGHKAWRTLRRSAFLERTFALATLCLGALLLFSAWFGLSPWVIGVLTLALQASALLVARSMIRSF